MSQSFSRANPSPRFHECLAQNRLLHIEGDPNVGIPPDRIYSGMSIVSNVDRLKRLVQSTNSYSLLDYGCGKGFQYQVPVVDLGLPEKEMLSDYLGVTGIQLYDPCIEQLAQIPTQKSDGVACVDVLQLCPEEDLPWIIDELFRLANNFVFVTVSCFPAKKLLSNGSNPHCTIQNEKWWVESFQNVRSNYPDVLCELVLISLEKDADGISRANEQIFNFGARSSDPQQVRN